MKIKLAIGTTKSKKPAFHSSNINHLTPVKTLSLSKMDLTGTGRPAEFTQVQPAPLPRGCQWEAQ
jgi:hypothetical protein